MEAVLKINGISKGYKRKEVLSRVNMTINKGDIYGLTIRGRFYDCLVLKNVQFQI